MEPITPIWASMIATLSSTRSAAMPSGITKAFTAATAVAQLRKRCGIKSAKTCDPPRSPRPPLDSLPPVREGLCPPSECQGPPVRGVQDGEL